MHVSANLTTIDMKNDECVLYLIEDGPWPQSEDGWRHLLKPLQDKILDVIDASVDGGVAKVYRESLGMKVRIQIDSPSGCPEKLTALISKINEYIQTNNEYVTAITTSPFVSGVRVVSGASMGRFGASCKSNKED